MGETRYTRSASVDASQFSPIFHVKEKTIGLVAVRKDVIPRGDINPYESARGWVYPADNFVLVSSCWERIVLKECPYQFGRVESSCEILRAHHDMLRPGVSHPTDKIMHDRHMITTAHPFFPNDIGLMKEDGWIASAMIAFSPLS